MTRVLCSVLSLLAAVPQGPSSDALIKRLQSPDGRVRVEACAAVVTTPSSDPRVIKAVLAAKEHEPPAVDAMQTVNYQALLALEACGAAAVPILIAGLDDRRLLQRAAGALGSLRPIDPRTVPALRKCLAANAADTASNCSVVLAIGALGADAKDAVPDLIGLAKSRSLLGGTLSGSPAGLFYGNVITAMGMIGPGAAAAIPTLLTLAATEKGLNAPMVRRQSLEALGEIGFGVATDAKTAARQTAAIFAALRKGRTDVDASVVTKAEAASALLDPDYDAPVKARELGLRHRDARIRLQTCRILGAMGNGGAAARQALENAANKDTDEAVRKAAAAALLGIGG
ncbi:MAG: hypothetical protein IPK26_03685 [Planctomycetes bacterium]|nr:hypothetical protein [Planctomycetota bacterium]